MAHYTLKTTPSGYDLKATTEKWRSDNFMSTYRKLILEQSAVTEMVVMGDVTPVYLDHLEMKGIKTASLRYMHGEIGELYLPDSVVFDGTYCQKNELKINNVVGPKLSRITCGKGINIGKFDAPNIKTLGITCSEFPFDQNASNVVISDTLINPTDEYPFTKLHKLIAMKKDGRDFLLHASKQKEEDKWHLHYQRLYNINKLPIEKQATRFFKDHFYNAADLLDNPQVAQRFISDLKNIG